MNRAVLHQLIISTLLAGGALYLAALAILWILKKDTLAERRARPSILAQP